jgi:hypothetical protein
VCCTPGAQAAQNETQQLLDVVGHLCSRLLLEPVEKGGLEGGTYRPGVRFRRACGERSIGSTLVQNGCERGLLRGGEKFELAGISRCASHFVGIESGHPPAPARIQNDVEHVHHPQLQRVDRSLCAGNDFAKLGQHRFSVPPEHLQE